MHWGWDNSCGYANGYVAIPPEHPLYGCDYDDFYVNVHGGLTYGRLGSVVKNSFNPNYIELIRLEDIPDDYWVFVFDTMHWGDTLDN